jgi:uncharacterized surface protein with fasciclin (FAS1) repeats
MKNIFKNIKKSVGIILVSTSILITSCNKGFEEVPTVSTPSSVKTLAEIINSDANYSILRDGLIRAGLMNQLAVQGTNVTIFAPDNNAFIASGLSAAVVAAVPLTTLVPLLQYHMVQTRLPGTSIPSTFPNVQMPSLLQLPGGNPLVRMNIFPAKNGTNYFVNNLPIVQTDAIVASNGIMHRVPFIVQPPQQLLAQMIYTDPNFTYLTAAIARADSGQVGLNKFDSIIKFGVANVTVFAPNDNAFKTLLFGVAYQGVSQAAYRTVYRTTFVADSTVVYNTQIAGGATPAAATAAAIASATIAGNAAATAYVNNPVNMATFATQATALTSNPVTFFNNPAFYGALPASSVRGIVAYHILTSRAYSVNLPLTTSNITTALNGAISGHPGITVDQSTANPRLLGFGNGAGNYSNFVATDRNGVNGVWHVIDRVLLPQ